MTKLNLVAAGALALGLAATAFASHAQPYGKGGNYSLAPAARASAQGEHRPHMRMAKCDCPMMKGDAAMRDQCMAMMRDHHGDTYKPGQLG
jgi:hypothetical protein